MAKIAGTAYFTIDGQRYSLKGNMTVALGARERETVVGLDNIHGFKEMPAAAFIECDVTDKPDFNINDLNDLEDSTVTVELINGKVGVLRNAWQVNNIELNVDEGELTVRFEGPKGEWIA